MGDPSNRMFPWHVVKTVSWLGLCVLAAMALRIYDRTQRARTIYECMATLQGSPLGKRYAWCDMLEKEGVPPLVPEKTQEKPKGETKKQVDLSDNKRLVSDVNLPAPPPRGVEPGSADDPCMQTCVGLEKQERGRCLLKCHDWRRLCLNDKELVAYEEALEDCLARSDDPLLFHDDCEHMAALEACW